MSRQQARSRMPSTRYGDVVKLWAASRPEAPEALRGGHQGVSLMRPKRTPLDASDQSDDFWIYNDARRQALADAKRAAGANHRANTLAVSGRITIADVRAVLAARRCFYCGTTRRVGIDHVVPMVLGGANARDNLVACCRSCNASKGRADRPWRWSQAFDACRDCQTTERKHYSGGQCQPCHRRAKKQATAP
jgi:hypothetical protein